MSISPERGLATILADLLAVTNRMVEQRHDAEFLIEGIEKRRLLMEEYDALAETDAAAKAAFEKDPAARETVSKMMAMDKTIEKALADHKADVHKDVSSVNAQKKVLDYLGKPQAGSLMDYKK